MADFRWRYTLFDSGGALVRTAARPVRSVPRQQHPLRYADGAILDVTASPYPRLVFLRVDTAGASVDTAGGFRRRELPPGIGGRPIHPGGAYQTYGRHYFARTVWTLAPDGTLWTSDTGELRLIQRTLEGDTLRVVHTRHRSSALEPADEAVVEAAAREIGMAPEDLQAVRPIVQSIHVMEDGTVLVQIEKEVGEDGSTFDVFDPEGVFLGSLDLGFAPARRGLPTFRGDTLLAPTLGLWDVPYVVKAVIERPRGPS